MPIDQQVTIFRRDLVCEYYNEIYFELYVQVSFYNMYIDQVVFFITKNFILFKFQNKHIFCCVDINVEYCT